MYRTLKRSLISHRLECFANHLKALPSTNKEFKPWLIAKLQFDRRKRRIHFLTWKPLTEGPFRTTLTPHQRFFVTREMDSVASCSLETPNLRISMLRWKKAKHAINYRFSIFLELFRMPVVLLTRARYAASTNVQSD